MTKCSKCGLEFREDQLGIRMASISGTINGASITESYFLCPECNVFTIEVFKTMPTGAIQVMGKGPLSRQDVEHHIDIIKKCPEPWNRKCGCEAHLHYFRDFTG